MDSSTRGRKDHGPRTASDLRKLHLLRPLSEPMLAQWLPVLERVWRPHRARAPLRDGFNRRVGFVWSGRHRLVFIAPSGRTVTLGEIAPGDVFGHALAVLGYDPGDGLHLQTDQAGLLLHLTDADFAHFAERMPDFNNELIRALAGHLVENSSRLYEIGALDVRSRLQSEIIRLSRGARWVGAKLIIRPAPTQAALAAQIASTREVVAAQLKQLAAERLIRFGRGFIEVLDLDTLKAMDRAAAGRDRYTRL